MEAVSPDLVMWPFVLYTFIILVLVGIMLGLSFLLGERHQERATGEPYESGMVVTGTARLRFDVRFYLVAVFFVIFDLEAVFIFGWAVAIRELGWAGYIEIVIFVSVLLAGLAYLWKLGALEMRKKTGYAD
jgi:NADH-quinone oxidoreductase subunit A